MIVENKASKIGGGIWIEGGNATITGSTISDNITTVTGIPAEGIHVTSNATVTIKDSIVWNNLPDNIVVDDSSLAVTYCDIDGGYPGTGNINTDPSFIDPGNDDYHLAEGSACIDVGDPTVVGAGRTDIDGEVRVNSIIEMGADEFHDCNANGVPDHQDIAGGASGDCNWNHIPDDCELSGNDCNTNGVPDECDVDCNANGTPDDCEGTIAACCSLFGVCSMTLQECCVGLFFPSGDCANPISICPSTQGPQPGP